MSDIIDDANEQAELILALQLRQRRKEGQAPTGKCLWCDEPVADPRRWCDKECMEDYEHFNRR